MKSKTDTWMPLYIGDYLRDTMHLSHDQHGVYLLLLFHYWACRQPLPDDDVYLAHVAKLSLEQWLSYKPSILLFFSCVDGKLVHKRVEQELAKAFKLRQARSKGGKITSNARWSTKNIAQQPAELPLSNLLSNTPSPSPSPIGTEGTQSEQGVQGEPAPSPLSTASPDHPPTHVTHVTHVTPAHSSSLTTPPAPTRFQKPTLRQVTARAAELGLPAIEAEKFFNYYESNGWKVGRNPMKSWPHALQNWKNNASLYANHSTNRRPGPDRSAGTANAGIASQYKLG